MCGADTDGTFCFVFRLGGGGGVMIATFCFVATLYVPACVFCVWIFFGGTERFAEGVRGRGGRGGGGHLGSYACVMPLPAFFGTFRLIVSCSGRAKEGGENAAL